MSTSSALGRFKIIRGYPPVLPHKCAVCGTSESGNYIDFGLDLDFYGTVYLCLKNCFVEAANSIDYYSPAQHGLALERVEQLRKENNRLLDIVEAYKNVIGNIDHINTSAAPDSNIDPIRSDPVQEFEITPERTAAPKKPEPGLIEQIDGQGPSDIQRDDSLDDLINDI